MAETKRYTTVLNRAGNVWLVRDELNERVGRGTVGFFDQAIPNARQKADALRDELNQREEQRERDEKYEAHKLGCGVYVVRKSDRAEWRRDADKPGSGWRRIKSSAAEGWGLSTLLPSVPSDFVEPPEPKPVDTTPEYLAFAINEDRYVVRVRDGKEFRFSRESGTWGLAGIPLPLGTWKAWASDPNSRVRSIPVPADFLASEFAKPTPSPAPALPEGTIIFTPTGAEPRPLKKGDWYRSGGSGAMFLATRDYVNDERLTFSRRVIRNGVMVREEDPKGGGA